MKRLAFPLRLAGLTAGLLLLAACASTPPPQPAYFTLDPGRPASLRQLRAGDRPATASVRFVGVAAPFAGDGFVYRTDDHGWESDPYNQFLVSPAQLMTAALRTWLRQSGLYGEVAESDLRGGQDHFIEAHVTELYGDFRNLSAPTAVLSMEVQVFRPTDQGRVLALRKTFTRTVPVAQRTPAALVAAWNEALRVELNELLRALAGLRS